MHRSPTPSPVRRRLAAVALSAGLLATAQPADLAAQTPTRFSDITAQTGINFTHTDRLDTMAGGVCVLDYDNDGHQDVFATARGGGSNRLWHNRGDGTFEDVTTQAGVGESFESMGAYAQDLDNDGDVEIIVIARFRMRIYENLGDGTFVDHAEAQSLGRRTWGVSATFGDYDNDGDLDIYVATYVYEGFFPYFTCYPNHLYRNDGNFQFTDVADQAGCTGEELVWAPQGGWRVTGSASLSCLFFDFDQDGWQDIFVGNDFGPFITPNQLYRNQGDGTFVEIAAAHDFRIPEFNMGLAIADVNRDGNLDIYTSNFGPNHLLFGNGRGRFWDAAPSWNATEGFTGPNNIVTWAAMFLDADLDGWVDLYVSNGFVQAVPTMPADPRAPSRLLMNLGNSMFTLPEPLFPWDRDVGRGAACGDLDGDGDEDLVQLNNRAQLKIYRNDTITSNQAAILSLRGTLSNRDGAGAVLEMQSRSARQTIAYARGGSYGSGNAAPIIRGLGADPRVEELTVRWPSGVTSHHFDLIANQRHDIVEPQITVDSVGNWYPFGTEWVEVPVTVHNHAATPQPVALDFKLVYGDLRSSFPGVHLPATVPAHSSTVVRLYLPIPQAGIALGRQLGIWYEVGAADSLGGRDATELPVR